MAHFQEDSAIAKRLTNIVLMLCFAGISAAFAGDDPMAVDCITIEPADALTSRELSRLTMITPPDSTTSAEINSTAENIRATGRFSDVSWSLRPAPCGRQLVFKLEPQSYVAHLSFRGNHQVSDRRLARSSDLRKWQPFSAELLDRSLVQLRDYYILKGFPAPQFQTEVKGPGDDGAMDVRITVQEIPLPKAQQFAYTISGHPGPWWRMRLRAVLLWARWKATRRGLNMESLRSLLRHEEKTLKETGYRNAEITLRQAPGEVDCHPCLTIDADVNKPVKIHFENVGFLTRRDILHNWKRTHVDMSENELERLVNATQNRLREDGWLDVEVHSKMQEKPKVIAADIHADKGLRRFISDVTLTGKSPVIPDEVGAITGLHLPRLFGLWKTRPGPDRLEDAEKALKTHLENLGYPRPQCRVTVDDASGEAAAIRVVADAGPQRLIGTVSFEGNQDLETDTLIKIADINTGDPYVRRRVKQAITSLTKWYLQQGYSDVRIRARTRRRGGAMDITFQVEEGPGYRQGPLVLRGNVKTRSSVIYALHSIPGGDPFNLEEVGKLQEALYRTGVFETVSIRTEKHPGASPPYQTVVLDLVERSTGEFETGIDFNTDRGLEWVLEVGERNLLGQALHGRISGLLGQERWMGAVSLGRPILLGYPLENRIRAMISHDETNSGYDLRTYGVDASVSRTWDNDLSLKLTYSFEREDVRNLDPDVADEIDIQDTRTGAVTPILTIDRRDDPFRSTRGWFYQTRFKTSLNTMGSDAEFLRWDHDLRGFLPLNRNADTVLCTALRFGRGWILADSVIPAGERFFLGGADTNRGFDHKECGPRTADGDPLGGLSYILANLELRFHLAGRMHAAIFADAGNVFADTPDAPYLRPSAGFGLRYETPIGPFRADMGFNLDPEPGESDYVVQIALGHAF